MKKILTPLALAVIGVVAVAQTNNAPAPKAERGPTVITADTWEIGWDSRKSVYTGNVRVNDPQMQLTCDFLTAQFRTNVPNLEVQTITAEKHVVIDALDWEGRTNHATADKLVYSYSIVDSVTNQTLELTGNPRLTNSLGGISGDLIFVDLVKGKVFSKNTTTSIQPAGTKAISEEVFGKGKSAETNQPTTSPK